MTSISFDAKNLALFGTCIFRYYMMNEQFTFEIILSWRVILFLT